MCVYIYIYTANARLSPCPTKTVAAASKKSSSSHWILFPSEDRGRRWALREKMINRARPTFISLRSSSDCLTLYIYIYIYAYQYRTLFLDVYDFDFTWHHGYLRGRSLSRPCSGLDAQPRGATRWRRDTTDELQQVRWQNCLDEPEESWEFCWGWSKNDYHLVI